MRWIVAIVLIGVAPLACKREERTFRVQQPSADPVQAVARLWRAAGRAGAGIQKWEAGCFAAGWFALFVALVSPLHPWGSVLFSVHMTQHEILMLVAAPLLVLGKPLVASLRALPGGWARRLAQAANKPEETPRSTTAWRSSTC